ncbi:hypothetical protein JW859_13430 [bacterium]|nr:hypothetical protein [bacterium]
MRLPAIVALILLGLIATGCPQEQPERNTAPPPVDLTSREPASPWLNPAAQVISARRATCPDGYDIRQALYHNEPGSAQPEIILRLRDYNSRLNGQPDAQMLISVPHSGSAQRIELPDSTAALAIYASPSHQAWLALLLNQAEETDYTQAPLSLYHATGNASYPCSEETRLWPLGLTDDDTVIARPLKALQLDNGLLAESIDWAGGAQRLTLSAVRWEADLNGLFAAGDVTTRTAGYTISYEPVLPADAALTYFVSAPSPKLPSLTLLTSAYHVSYTVFAWAPPLAWVEKDRLATVQFLPDCLGPVQRPNHNGLFRLVTLDTKSRTLTLVEDHLPAGLPFAAGGGVLFYTLQRPSGDRVRWELWAASSDGLAKLRLWNPDDNTLYLSVEDQLNGRRVLVNRQVLDTSGSQPLLTNELREFSLDPLPTAQTPLGIEPLRPVQPAAADDPLSPFAGGPPPIAIPD